MTYPTLVESTLAHMRAEVRARADQDMLAALAERVHTTVEVWVADPDTVRVRLGGTVVVSYRRPVVPEHLSALAHDLWAAWKAHTPDVPPNVTLGTE